MKYRFQEKMQSNQYVAKNVQGEKIKIYNNSKRFLKEQAWKCGLDWKDTEK